MNKKELVAALAEATGKSDADARRSINALIAILVDVLSKGGQIRLTGFGQFQVKKRAQRQGRNPQTGKPLLIKASNQPSFTAGKDLKQAVN